MDYPQANVAALTGLEGAKNLGFTSLNRGGCIFIALTLSVAGITAFSIVFEPRALTLFTLVFGCLLMPLAFRYPVPSFFTMLIVRSVVDVVADEAVISAGGIGLNLSSVMGVFLMLWGGWYLVRHRAALKIPAITLLSAFVVISVAGLFTSILPSRTLQELIKIADYALLFIIGYHLTTSLDRYRAVMATASFAIVIPSLFGVYQLLQSLPHPPEGHIRLMGTFAHPNAFAFALVLALSSWMVVFSLRASESAGTRMCAIMRKLPYRIIFTCLGLLILNTFTRGAWIGALLVLFLVGLRYARALTVIGGMVLLVSALSYPALKTGYHQLTGGSLTDIPYMQRIDPNSQDAGSYHWRRRSWMEMSVKLQSLPFLGYGLGSFQKLREETITYLTDLGAVEAHNDYLRLAIETGYGGVALYALFYFFIMLRVAHASVRTEQRHMQKAYTIVAACIASFMLMSSADNLLRATAAMWILWSVMGATIACVQHKEFKQPLLANAPL